MEFPKDINELDKELQDTKKFTHKNIDTLKEKIYTLKMKYIENEKVSRILQNMNELLDHEAHKLNSIKMTIISALGTIFLPLGFITGYFGMNFRSMGNPTLSSGVLATKNVERFILALSIFSISVIGSLYYINF